MKKRTLLMLLLAPLGVILYLDRICIGVALPRIQADLDILPEHLGWVSLAFSLGYAAFEVPGGHLGDKRGPRGVLTRIVLLWSVFTALTGAVTGFWSLVVTRFLFGAGEAGAIPNVSAAVSRWFPGHSRGKAMGAFLAASQLGGAITPLIVVPLQARFGWRVPFFAFGVVGASWATVWFLWFRDTPAEKSGVTSEELAELGTPVGRATHALPWRDAIRSKTLWALSASCFFAIYTVFFGVFWAPTFLMKARGFTEGELRWTAVTWIVGVLCNVAGGAVSDALVVRFGRSWGRRVAGGAGLAIVAIAYASAAATSGKVTTLAALTVASAGWGVTQPTFFATCVDVGRTHAGTVSGVMNTAGQIGGALSAVAFGYLVKATGSYEIPVYIMAGVGVLASACWILIDASKPIVADDVPRIGGLLDEMPEATRGPSTAAERDAADAAIRGRSEKTGSSSS